MPKGLAHLFLNVRGVTLLLIMLVTACAGGGGSASSSTSVGGGSGSSALQSITVTPKNPALVFGDSVQFVATATYADGSTQDISGAVVWSSTNPATTNVSASGLVSAVSLGTSTVVASSGGMDGRSTVTVSGGLATESILHTFGPGETDGLQPDGLIQASDGNFYGTTQSGGANTCFGEGTFCGTVFRITPDGVETILYTFGATATDGWHPVGPLIQASDGELYGTTASGGAYGAGTVFKLSLSGAETILYSFGASPADGAVPVASLVQASDGNFYGTTASGGANYCNQIPGTSNNCGSVFKITPTGVETVLYSFGASVGDGVEPTAPLIQASDGNFYGTTSDGGTNACGIPPATNCGGTVFMMTPAGTESVLHSFGASPADGIAPQGPLVQARDGNFYGTTAGGGGFPCNHPNSCGGTMYRITPAGSVSILYRFGFTPANEGSPSGCLILGSDGNFYGTTIDGGPYENPGGVVYTITPQGVRTILYSFNSSASDGTDPIVLLQARDGNFYGVTNEGGGDFVVSGQTVMGSGTVFKLIL